MPQKVTLMQRARREGSAELMYRIACPSCGEDYEATTATWCRCLNKDRSLICPACRECFCEASSTFRNQFWRDAPERLWEVRRKNRSSENTVVLRKPLVLVVDDDPEIRYLGLELISRFGYGCITASNGAIAKRLARRYQPDLVLTDLLMPGIDGRELSRALKTDPQIAAPKIIVMTSVYRGDVYENEAREKYGVDEYLEKPIPMQTLRAVLAELLPEPEQSHAILSPSSDDLSLESLDDIDDDDVTIVG